MVERTIDLVHVRLQTRQPMSVTAPESAGIKSVDLPIAKRPTDAAPYVPATSVVGALRDHAAATLPAAQVVALFGGSAPNDGRDPDAALRPSLVRAMGTRTTVSEQVALRKQTAIDRFRASAATGSMRTRESLAAGTLVEIYLSLVAAEPGQVASLRDLLATWQPILGGGRSVGHGRAQVSQVRHRRLDLSLTDQLAEWLDLGGPGDWVTDGWQEWPIPPAPAGPEVRFDFDLVDDLLVATAKEVGDPEPTSLPASSIKGIFRSRAEFVLRTLGLRACASTLADPATALAAGLQPACRIDPCLTCQLFGYAGEGRGHPGQRAMVWFHDAELRDVRIAARTHVAIDRFTGGQAHGKLFNQQVVESAKVVVAVDIGRKSPDDPLARAARALLGIVALDIHDGHVGLGGSTARGMGSARLSQSHARALRHAWIAELPHVRAAADSAAAPTRSGQPGGIR